MYVNAVVAEQPTVQLQLRILPLIEYYNYVQKICGVGRASLLRKQVQFAKKKKTQR